MTTSLPPQELRVPTRKEAILNAAAGVTLRSLPRIPNPVKRAMLGGRSVTIDGNTLDTTLQLMLSGQRMIGKNGLADSGDVDISRAEMRALAESLTTSVDAEWTDISLPGPDPNVAVPARHYRVPDDGAPLLVYFHGGGFVIGDVHVYHDLCQRICRDGGLHVLSVEYRLAPEHKAPAAAEDAMAAYRWALSHAAELGADPERVAVGGDSAGANLATVVSRRARDEGVRVPTLQLLLYPWLNLRGETRSKTLFADHYLLTKNDLDWFADQYLDGAAVHASEPIASPLLADDLAGLPPALVLTGGFDPLRDEGRQYAEALRAAGVTVDHREFGSLIHGFANLFPVGGGSATATTESISALRAHLART